MFSSSQVRASVSSSWGTTRRRKSQMPAFHLTREGAGSGSRVPFWWPPQLALQEAAEDALELSLQMLLHLITDVSLLSKKPKIPVCRFSVDLSRKTQKLISLLIRPTCRCVYAPFCKAHGLGMSGAKASTAGNPSPTDTLFAVPNMAREQSTS